MHVLESMPAVFLCCLQRVKAALEQASMAITNPLAAAVSNLMLWVPKNVVRNEKLMKEVGLAQETLSVDYCCGFNGLCVLCVADAGQKIPVQASLLC